MVDGLHYPDEELSLILRQKLDENPRASAGLTIHKNCKMEIVYTVTDALKEAKFYRVSFLAKLKINQWFGHI